MRIFVPIIVAFITAISAVVAAWVQSGELKALQSQSVGTLVEGQKVCRVHKSEYYIDSIVVPKSWTASNCAQYAKKNNRVTENNLYFSLGCVYEDDVYFGDDLLVISPNDAKGPVKDCGWY